MAIKTTPWNSAEYLKTDEDIRLYLDACLEEAGEDPALIAHALGVVAKAKNLSDAAAALDAKGRPGPLTADDNPSFATIAKATKALGLRLKVEERPV